MEENMFVGTGGPQILVGAERLFWLGLGRAGIMSLEGALF